jgi:hypothetical protein
MLSPVVSFARHTDRSTIFGRAPFKSASLTIEINDEGGAQFVFDTAALRDIHWSNTALASPEDVRVWDGPTVIFAQVNGRWFSFVVKQVRFVYPDSAEFWDGTVEFSCAGGATMLRDTTFGTTSVLIAVQTARASLLVITPASLDGIESTWTAGLDSGGVAWTDNDFIRARSGPSLLSKIEEWAPTTWEWTATADVVAGVGSTKINLYKSTGIDKTGTVVLFAGAHALDGRQISETWDFSGLATEAYTEVTGAGVETTSTLSIGDSIARWGRRTVSISSTPLASVTQALTDAVTQGSKPVRTRTFPIDPTVVGARPFVDFELGDRVGVGVTSPRNLGTTVTPSRVMGVTVEQTAASGASRCELILDESLSVRRKQFQAEEQAKAEDEGSTYGGTSTKGSDFDPLLTTATGGEKGGTLGLWDVPGASSVAGLGAIPSANNWSTYQPSAEPSGLPLFIDPAFTSAVPDVAPKVIMQSAKRPNGDPGPALVLDPNTNEIKAWAGDTEVTLVDSNGVVGGAGSSPGLFATWPSHSVIGNTERWSAPLIPAADFSITQSTASGPQALIINYTYGSSQVSTSIGDGVASIFTGNFGGSSSDGAIASMSAGVNTSQVGISINHASGAKASGFTAWRSTAGDERVALQVEAVLHASDGTDKRFGIFNRATLGAAATQQARPTTLAGVLAVGDAYGWWQ